jgi:hypothetical protein
VRAATLASQQARPRTFGPAGPRGRSARRATTRRRAADPYTSSFSTRPRKQQARPRPMATHAPSRPQLPSIPSGDIELSWPSGSSSQDHHYGGPAAALAGAPPSPLSPTGSVHSASSGGRIRAGAFGKGSRSSAGSTSEGDRVRRLTVGLERASSSRGALASPFVLLGLRAARRRPSAEN